MGSTTRPPGSQTRGELLPQRPTGLDEQRPIDGFVRHAHLKVVRVVHPQSGTDLLRRPPRVQQRFHLGAEPGTPAELCGLGPTCLRVGGLVSATCPIPPGTTVAVDLAAHGGRRPAKTTRDRPIRCSASSPRETSSRSANDSCRVERVAGRGGMPPTIFSSRCTVFVEHRTVAAASSKLQPPLMSRRTASRSSRVSRTPRIRLVAIALPPPLHTTPGFQCCNDHTRAPPFPWTG